MSASPPASFEETIDAARAGDAAAWRVLYTTYSPAVVGYLRARGVSDPDDLVGEVFLNLVRGLAGFSGEERAFRAFLFTIAHRRMVDAVRARVRRREDPVEDVIVLAARQTGDAEAEALSAVTDSEVLRALEKLTADQRAVLTLRVFGDMTLEEIARATGKGLGAVKQLQRRGLAALRREAAVRVVPLEVPIHDSLSR